jgi:hypothetical protein
MSSIVVLKRNILVFQKETEKTQNTWTDKKFNSVLTINLFFFFAFRLFSTALSNQHFGAVLDARALFKYLYFIVCFAFNGNRQSA